NNTHVLMVNLNYDVNMAMDILDFTEDSSSICH
ncbi:MAG: hypothetical protein ACI935_003406, partial [Moritella dasanensis]